MISLPTHSNTERPGVGLFSCRNYGLVTPSLPIFHGRRSTGRNQLLLSAPLSIAKTHEWLLALTGVVVIDVLPVVGVTTVGHQTTHAQDDDTTALRANRPGGCHLRRCNDAAARRYCCLHRLLSSVSRLRAAPPPPPTRYVELRPYHQPMTAGGRIEHTWRQSGTSANLGSLFNCGYYAWKPK